MSPCAAVCFNVIKEASTNFSKKGSQFQQIIKQSTFSYRDFSVPVDKSAHRAGNATSKYHHATQRTMLSVRKSKKSKQPGVSQFHLWRKQGRNAVTIILLKMVCS